MYFALEKGPKLADEIWNRWLWYVTYLQSSNRYRVYVDSHAMRNGWGRMGETWFPRRIGRGPNGALLRANINDYGSLWRSISTLVSAQLPAGEPKATNTDQKSLAAAQLASGLVAYHKNAGLDEQLRTAIGEAVALAESWFYAGWDPLAGPEIPWEQRTDEEKRQDSRYDEATGEFTPLARHEGAPDLDIFGPIDVARDLGTTGSLAQGSSLGRPNWVILRRWVNRWELAARFPGEEEKVRWCESATPWAPTNSIRLDPTWTARTAQSSPFTDVVAVYLFLHAKTKAVPEGVRALILAPGQLLEYGPLPPCYGPLPVYPLFAEVERDTPFGTTQLWDCQAPQDAANMATSLALTKGRLGTGKVLTHVQSGVDPAALSSDNAVVKWSGQEAHHKPEMMAATVSPEGDMALAGAMVASMERVSGINSVARGNTQALGSDPSGSLVAFVQAQALAANSGLQARVYTWIGDAYTAIVKLYEVYSPTGRPRRLVAIAGKSQSASVIEFVGEDLSGVERVHVEAANPATTTTQGRISTLNLMATLGLQLTPEKVLEFLTTGRWETTVEDEQNLSAAVRTEVEKLREGIPGPVMLLDNHPRYIHAIHAGMLSNRETRMDPQLVQVAMAQIERRHQAWLQAAQQYPGLLMVLGIPPPPELAALGALGVGPPPTGGPSGPAARAPKAAPETGEPKMPAMPQMPKAAGGERAEPQRPPLPPPG